MLGIVTGVTAHRHPQSFRMLIVPMAALAAPALKPGPFQIGCQLANRARHSSIKIVSQRFKTVKQLNLARHGTEELFNAWGRPACGSGERDSGIVRAMNFPQIKRWQPDAECAK